MDNRIPGVDRFLPTSKVFRMRKQVLAISVCLSLCGALIGLPAQANLTPYESRLSVSFTEATSGTGASRSIEFVATVNDSGSDLMMHSNPTGSQVRIEGLNVFMCATAQPSSSLGYNAPTGCVFFGGTALSNSGSSSSWTFSRTYSGQEFDNRISTHPFVVPTLHFRDASDNRLAIHGSVIVQTSASSTQESPPTKYSGPEFSSLSLKPVMQGAGTTLSGKNLDEISSLEIGGKAATFKLDGDSSLNFSLPAGLAPGVYDLVVNSSAGKLTHLRAIEVRESATPTSFSTTTLGLGTEPAFQKHRDFAATQHSSLNKARCVVNASSQVTVELRAKRLCALIGFSNANLKSFVIEARSTVTSAAIYARVHFGIDQ